MVWRGAPFYCTPHGPLYSDSKGSNDLLLVNDVEGVGDRLRQHTLHLVGAWEGPLIR